MPAIDAAVARHCDLQRSDRVTPRDDRIGAALTLAVIVAWAGRATWRPHVTDHLAPVLQERRGRPSDARSGANLGGMIAVAASLALWVGLLEGPTIRSDGPAVDETIPAALLGALRGYRYTRCGPRIRGCQASVTRR